MLEKINNVHELRVSLAQDGYGVYIISNDGQVPRFTYEIDYIPKTDKFLVQTLDTGAIARYTAPSLLKSMIGKAIIDGEFYKQ